MTIDAINTELKDRGLRFILEAELINSRDEHYDGAVLRSIDGTTVCSIARLDILEGFTDMDACISYLTNTFYMIEKMPAFNVFSNTAEELYRMVQPRIFPAARIREYLDRDIYAEEYNGFGLSYIINPGFNVIVPVASVFIEMKGLDLERLRSEAFDNLAGMYHFVTIGDMIAEITGVSSVPVPDGMYVLSTNDGLEGASVIFCETAMKAARTVLGDRFYIIPSSVHEVLLLRDGMVDPESLARIIHEVNDTRVADKDILGWVPYLYDHGVITAAI